jgi:hypothetical protein
VPTAPGSPLAAPVRLRGLIEGAPCECQFGCPIAVVHRLGTGGQGDRGRSRHASRGSSRRPPSGNSPRVPKSRAPVRALAGAPHVAQLGLSQRDTQRFVGTPTRAAKSSLGYRGWARLAQWRLPDISRSAVPMSRSYGLARRNGCSGTSRLMFRLMTRDACGFLGFPGFLTPQPKHQNRISIVR